MPNVVSFKNVVSPVVCVIPENARCDNEHGVCSAFGWAHFNSDAGILKSGEFLVDIPCHDDAFYPSVRSCLKKIFKQWKAPSRPFVLYPFQRDNPVSTIKNDIHYAGIAAIRAFAKEHGYPVACAQFRSVSHVMLDDDFEIQNLIDLLRDLGSDITYDQTSRAKAVAFAYYEHHWRWRKNNPNENRRRNKA